MDLPRPKQWEPLAIIPIAAGLYWLLAAADGGWLILGLLPGTLMLATGVALLLLPGDLRITEYMAAGGLLGLVLVLPVMIFGGFGDGLLGAVLALAAGVTAGRAALDREPLLAGTPPPVKTLAVSAKAALDEALLAYFVGSAPIPSGDAIARLGAEARQLEDVLTAKGWLEHPESLHRAPPVPDRVYVQQARIYGRDYERLNYASGFTLDPALPRAENWVQHPNNHQAAAWVLRHPGPPRPWLVCVHGYRMGEPWLDFLLFPPRWLHERLGLNVLMPVLPLHGPRRRGLRSGDGYLDGDPLELLYAETQALWDLRRALAWIRSQEDAARIGVLGYSLGGYNAGLLVQYEKNLDFAVAGIPAVDLAASMLRHLPPPHREYFSIEGLTLERYRTVLRPVSPLTRPPLLARERLYIFAGAADRIVLPDQPLQLARHWNVPIQWYQGGHLSFRHERVVREHIEAALQRAGWPIPTESVPAR
ncbi:MAG: prolyl oligopeptidase family serine peptidase [Nevskiales bacterium]|nr:prolyl oligopeptidase family serine peptidase [Nevskiales bacterium]